MRTWSKSTPRPRRREWCRPINGLRRAGVEKSCTSRTRWRISISSARLVHTPCGAGWLCMFAAAFRRAGQTGQGGASGHRHDVEDALDHAVLVDAGGFRLEGEDQAMTQDVEQHRLDVLRADEVAAGQPGMGA